MLLKRLIVCLDVRGGRVTKGVKFKDNVDVGDPVDLAARYAATEAGADGTRTAGADELVFYDITASAERRAIDLAPVRALARRLAVPLTVGGGLRNLDDLRAALLAGADKVSVNSLAVAHPELLAEGARRFGRQCMVLGLDAREIPPPPGADPADRRYEVVVEGGRRPTGMDAVAWAVRAVELGAGEICLNAIDADGVGEGYALDATRRISDAVGVPVIASGGAGSVEDIARALGGGPDDGHADAALVASMVHGGAFTCGGIKRDLARRGVPVRR